MTFDLKLQHFLSGLKLDQELEKTSRKNGEISDVTAI